MVIYEAVIVMMLSRLQFLVSQRTLAWLRIHLVLLTDETRVVEGIRKTPGCLY